MLSEIIKSCPPVRRGNDLQEQVDVPAGQVYAQAKHTVNAQSTDEAINSAGGLNWIQTQNLNKRQRRVGKKNGQKRHCNLANTRCLLASQVNGNHSYDRVLQEVHQIWPKLDAGQSYGLPKINTCSRLEHAPCGSLCAIISRVQSNGRGPVLLGFWLEGYYARETQETCLRNVCQTHLFVLSLQVIFSCPSEKYCLKT